MGFTLPKGWEKDSDKLFIHNTGVRIQRMTYRQKEGWFLVPVDLDQPVVEFDPTPDGRDKAFEAFAKGVLAPVKTKKASKAKAKAEEPESDDDEEEEAADEKADPKEKEKEEDTEPDQGDED